MLPVPDSNTKLQASLNGYSAKCNNKLSLTLDGGLLLILIVLSCIAVLWLSPPIPFAASDFIWPEPVSPVPSS